MGNVDKEEVIEIAQDYADEECLGEFGGVLDAYKEEKGWIVEFRTHTYSDSYDHRVTVTTTVGNIISHERGPRLN